MNFGKKRANHDGVKIVEKLSASEALLNILTAFGTEKG